MKGDMEDESHQYLKSNGLTTNKIVLGIPYLQQSLKTYITQILFSTTAYDCLPINSSISSIDKSVSLYDAINILISQNIEELLVWDEAQFKWIWMLTIADAIRIIMHSMKSITLDGKISNPCIRVVDFKNFQKIDVGHMNFNLTLQQIQIMIDAIKQKRLSDVIDEIILSQSRENGKSMEDELLSPMLRKPYIRLKSVVKESKLSYIIITMIVEKIHRIIIEDLESKMMISILNFKDIMVYLLRIANQASNTYYNKVPVKQLLDASNYKNLQIQQSTSIWEAFYLLTDGHKSVWLNVVDKDKCFKGMLFREDFRDIFRGWHLDCLWMTAGEFIKHKQTQYTGKIPEYRFFSMNDITKDIIWKIVMTRRNAIVCIDQATNRVISTIGLLQLFSLYIQQ